MTETKIGDIHYRCNASARMFGEESPVLFETWTVVKVTPCGYKVQYISLYNGQISTEITKFINKGFKKKWAYPTKAEAFDAYILRKAKYLQILKGRVATVTTEFDDAIEYRNKITSGELSFPND